MPKKPAKKPAVKKPAAKNFRTRRTFTDAKKRSILAEAAQPGKTKSAVAKKHKIAENLLYKWAQQFGKPPTMASPTKDRNNLVKGVKDYIASLDKQIATLAAERQQIMRVLTTLTKGK